MAQFASVVSNNDYSFNKAVGLEDHGLGILPKCEEYTPKPPNRDPSEARLPL